MMISDLYAPPSHFFWRELYRAALFEPNPAKLDGYIAQAESAIVLRVRQLFGERGNHVEEKQDLDDALYALQALKNILSRSSISNAA